MYVYLCTYVCIYICLLPTFRSFVNTRALFPFPLCVIQVSQKKNVAHQNNKAEVNEGKAAYT